MQTAKQVVQEVMESLPDDCTLDDISHRLYLRRKLDEATKAIAEGRVHSYEAGREVVQGLREFGRRAGWEDPAMDVYDDLDPRAKP